MSWSLTLVEIVVDKVINPAPSPRKVGREHTKNNDNDDDVSSFTESEFGILNPKCMSPLDRCKIWSKEVNQYYGEGSPTSSPLKLDCGNQQELASAPSTPSKSGVKKLVDYSPSSTSTYQSGPTSQTFSPWKRQAQSPSKRISVLVANARLLHESKGSSIMTLHDKSGTQNSLAVRQSEQHSSLPKSVNNTNLGGGDKENEKKETAFSFKKPYNTQDAAVLKAQGQGAVKNLSEKLTDASMKSVESHLTLANESEAVEVSEKLTTESEAVKDVGNNNPLPETCCIVKNTTLKLGVRHANSTSKKPNPLSELATSSAKTTVSSPRGTETLSAYQRLKLKNMRENEDLLKTLMHDKPPCKHLRSCNFSIPETRNKKTEKVQMKKNITLTKEAAVKKTSKPSESRILPKRSSKDTARSSISNHLQKGSDSESLDEESISEEMSVLSTPSSSDQADQDTDEDEEALQQNDSFNQTQDISQDAENGLDSEVHEQNHDAAEDIDDVGTEEESETVVKKSKAQERKERKQLINTGQSYVRSNGKTVAARKRTRPHECKARKCHEHITDDVGELIFTEYWQQGDHNKRVAYVAARIEWTEVERKRPREDDPKRQKEQTFKYFLEVNKNRIQVCRSTFLNTLGETDRFVRGVTENKARSGSGITTDDARGHHTPTHSLKPEVLEGVQTHIKMFPAYESHYCRGQTQHLYIASHLTVSDMYAQYKEEGYPMVSYSTYLREFKKSGRKLKPRKTDGCDKCQELQVAILSCKSDEEKENLKLTKELHQRKAAKAYQLKRDAKTESSKDPDKKRTLVFDLQQCLPTPHLTCKKVYYSRQLYVYNFTVYDNVTGLTYCYMWDQVEGKRGSNELASCLLEHILCQIPEGVEELFLFSDCCSGQNRNNVICMMLFTALQEHATLKKIHHYFLVPGHTFMPEVDSKHSVIEKHIKKKLEKVNVPSEWYTEVRNAGKSAQCPEGKFKVVHKTQFYDFSALAASELVKRNQCLDKDAFSYLNTHIFSYDKNAPGIVKVKSSFNEEAPFRDLSFLRRGVRSDRLPRLLPSLTVLPGNVPISKEKKNDLLGLLKYLNPEFHEFYKSLPTSNDPDTHPDFTQEPDADDPTV
ncbi:4-diphosphocytidyl-2-C-methyl-D-erythritol kinase [Frankliniella fusca]|uniref:4-diphosphocytidyl-2-C-methyl-D-erythritol kinase n=1 Tax=Frankliniella fusca TaxID=407009 RepID=A0AAE1I4T6_9NEOP|nr:4-diphosphocytidyl-2-C-methyl-D-erythritol kinase [Frankliniella fusca]